MPHDGQPLHGDEDMPPAYDDPLFDEDGREVQEGTLISQISEVDAEYCTPHFEVGSSSTPGAPMKGTTEFGYDHSQDPSQLTQLYQDDSSDQPPVIMPYVRRRSSRRRGN
ncbi:hypothetical protein MLD38_018371 [Melastoma candidum]|uniref:Uncharacterized protein n=1 Tax=Melastoma candidum TaxID=119954 RepID=A0ACB9QUQ3_9MYRT|nr:hypothetical protein MLD38_018371 [Melastoma candidum]